MKMNLKLAGIIRILGALVVLYVAFSAYMWATQKQYIFQPSFALQTTPDRLGMKYQTLRIPAGTGENRGELDAWWVSAQKTDAPTFVYLHGNDHNISAHLEHTKYLHDLGYNVLLADYRGFGKSSGGAPSEAKVYEDAEAAWQYLIRQLGARPEKTFIYGYSLGGAIGIDLALHHPEAAGLVTEGTFTTMRAMAEREYGFLPVDPFLNQRFESLQKIAQLKIPVLIIHGTWDKKVPVEMARQLYAAAPQPKTLTLIEGGEHGNSATVGAIEHHAAVSAFVNQYAH